MVSFFYCQTIFLTKFFFIPILFLYFCSQFGSFRRAAKLFK